jgi:hypothetical protein
MIGYFLITLFSPKSCPKNGVKHKLKHIKELRSVGNNLVLEGCSNLLELNKLKEVGGKIYLFESGITENYIQNSKKDLLHKCTWEK